jgi:hypothetical protein
MILGGPLKSNPTGPTKTQTIRFPKDKFTPEQARAWLKKNNITPLYFEDAIGDKKKIQTFVSLSCKRIQALTSNEILKIIPSSVLTEIKKTDPHPYFQAYSIAHEGMSTPKVIGDTQLKPIRWARKALQSIRNAVLKGIKFFIGHGETNETKGREPVGEIVADTQREIDGKIHHIVVGYFPDREKVADMDICSQEAEWNLWEYANEYVAGALEKITGIALSNSRIDQPAFSGARRLGLIQALDAEGSAREPEEKNMDLTTVPFDEIKKEVRRRQNHPHDIFTIEEIKAEKEVQALITEKETLTKTAKEHEERIKTLETANKDLLRKTEFVTAKDRIGKIAKEMKLTEKQIKYIENGFNDKLADVTDAGLKTFMEGKLVDFKQNAEFFGTKEENPNLSGKEEEHGEENAEDMSKAKNNPLLEKDLTE